ncbi:hypothetical protein GXM_07955 [Nostoc sphaeroides CCNUC1]|uniref:Uncharacterized protein n=1 Tax=Nostoc sphaeroides CCNUC1 TaxID=2653204 RepID=A0A5P8WD06_9NOSO|nr:hypothetical protein GXM_07955 [Nostoc sphaeroides CCNUC1]
MLQKLCIFSLVAASSYRMKTEKGLASSSISNIYQTQW